MRKVITHARPDGDAVAAAWLAAAYLFPGEEVGVAFVPRPRPGRPAPVADCVVDVGCVHDPARLMFDHKPPAFADRNSTCATRLVWEHLLALGRPVGHLEALVRVVHEGDRSPPARPSSELARSRSEGFHSRLKQARARSDDDRRIYQELNGWLDRYDREVNAGRGPTRGATQEGIEAMQADAGSPAAGAAIDVPEAAALMPTGMSKTRRVARKPAAPNAASNLEPNSPSGHTEFLVLETVLMEHASPCRRGVLSAVDAGAGPADRVVAMREAIGDLLARSEPDSKASHALRGLRVLVEVEAIAPGHLAGLRREADGWWSPLPLARGTPAREAVERVARDLGVGAEAVEGDLRLAEAIGVIAGNCGLDAIALLLTPGGRLRREKILQTARKGPERQRYAMGEATRGRDPLARPAGGAWPMDTRNFAKVPGRLGRALGAVEGCIDRAPGLLARLRPARDDLADAVGHLSAIIGHSARLLHHVEGRGAGGEAGGRATAKGRRGNPGSPAIGRPVNGPATWTQLYGRLAAARYFVEKTARDVPRLPPSTRPTAAQVDGTRVQVTSLSARARVLLGLLVGAR